MSDSLTIRSKTLGLPVEDVDTDQIFPGRYLTTTERTGLGRLCFFDWRHHPGSDKRKYFEDFDPEKQRILVAGANFGCGSSREHAAWSLLDMGIKAVISSKFGDIFHSNAQKNGLILVAVEETVLHYLFEHDQLTLEINIGEQILVVPGLGPVPFPLDPFVGYCLVEGIDAMDYLLRLETDIQDFEDSRN